MSKARLVITAVIVEKRPVSEVARSYGVARSWIYTLLARYRAEGEAAFEPRSRRPKTSPTAISDDTAELIIRAAQGAGRAGPGRRAAHHRLAPGAPPPDPGVGGDDQPVPDPGRAGHPRAAQAAEVVLHPVRGRAAERVLAVRLHPLAPGRRPARCEIVSWLDDHSRLALSVTAHPGHHRPGRPGHLPRRRRRVRRPGLHPDRQRHGLHHPVHPAAAAAATASRTSCAASASPRRTAARTTPRPRARSSDSSRPCKKWLPAQPASPPPSPSCKPSSTPFTDLYNTRRPHRSLPHRATPATAYTARPKASPGNRDRRHPRPRPRRHHRHHRHRHPPPRRPALPHRRRPDPRRNPRPAARPATCTSASSTPPPANSSASSPSTPPATTSPPAPPGPTPGPPQTTNTPNPNVGSGCPRCLETSHGGERWDSNPRHPGPQPGALTN